MADGIKLHPKLGVNPHLASCQRCGEETGEILLLGSANSIYECSHCHASVIGGGLRCPKCNTRSLKFVRELDEMEKVPSGLCADCNAEMIAHQKIVEEGWIYFQCDACKAMGVITKDKEIAQRVRREMKIDPPALCGLKVTQEECPLCRKEEN